VSVAASSQETGFVRTLFTSFAGRAGFCVRSRGPALPPVPARRYNRLPAVWTHPDSGPRRFPLPFLLLALLALGCRPGIAPYEGSPTTLLDDGGRVIALTAPPTRIVSLVPSMTDMVVLLGATHRLVARTRYDRGTEVAHLPSLGGGLDPNLEALVALRPDLVLVTPTEDLRPTVQRLEALGIPVYAGSTVTLEDLVRLTGNLGQILGPEAADAAGAFLDSLHHGLEALSRGFVDRPSPTVFYLVWNDPPMTVGPGSYLDDLISAAGGTNLFGDAPGPWPQVNLEEILHRNPDWVILPGASPDDPSPREWIGSAPGWRELEAVRGGRVAVVEANLFNRPGARFLEAARTLGGHLHP